MKAAFIAMCAVLATAVALCFLSMYIHHDVLGRMDYICEEAVNAVRADDEETALECAERLEEIFEGRQDALEMLASHNDLHETLNCITDAKVALECGDMDDAYQALVRLQGMITHLHDHERFSLANLL